MLDLFLRDIKEAFLKPFARVLGRFATPVQITCAGFIFGMLAVVSISLQSYWWGQFFWWVNRTLDGMDGVVARVTNQQTDLGIAVVLLDLFGNQCGFLDIIFDFVIYSFIPVAIVYSRPSSTFDCAALFHGAAILEKRNLGARLKDEKTTVTMPPALIEGLETMIFYTLFILFPQHSTLLFAIFGLLVWFTVIQRTLWGVKAFA